MSTDNHISEAPPPGDMPRRQSRESTGTPAPSDTMGDRPRREDFTALLEEGLEKGEALQGCVRKGRVIAIENDMALIDAGLKSEGYIPLREFTDLGHENLQEGDEIDVFVERMENKNGEAMLSFEKARRAAVWKDLEASYDKKEIVHGRIMSRVKGGFTVDLSGTPAFLPGSQVDVRPVRDITPLLEVRQPFQILKMDYRRGNIVVSRRAVLEESREVERSKLFETLEEGQSITGIVKNLTDYGAFIDLGGIDGLLHITDMAWHRVNHPGDILKVGQSVQVKVIRFKPDSRRISLGLKQLAPDPWDGIKAKYPEKAKFSAKVTNITDYGAFLELEPGVEGLAHISEMSWTRRNVHPSKLLSVSEQVDVIILQVDPERRRISLGIKQCSENPWEAFAKNHSVGDIVEGTVRLIEKDRLIIGLENDLHGVLAAGDIDWEKDPAAALAEYHKDQSLKARILSLDIEKETVALGVKQLIKDPFDEKYKDVQKGAVATCTIEKVADQGITVSLPSGVEGFIKRAELAVSREDRSAHRFAQGERVDAMIVKVDRKARQVQLSIKAREEQENRQAIAEFGTADSGARLGDILGPAFEKARRDGDGEKAAAPAKSPTQDKKSQDKESQGKESQGKESQGKESQGKESKTAAASDASPPGKEGKAAEGSAKKSKPAPRKKAPSKESKAESKDESKTGAESSATTSREKASPDKAGSS